MALVVSTGFAHVRITVSDIARSKKFYDTVFGWPLVVDTSSMADDPGIAQSPERFFGGAVYQTPQGTLFGLRPGGNGAFDPQHMGLDHVSFAVAGRAELAAAQSALADAGIPHGAISVLEEAGIAILSFQDPDDINIELTAPLD
ncbi:VOC family protein [Mycolicibacterium obuense]|uniref:Glyoxalase-like domain protein n=1 Tax=Mycolicibacterium obuense TaxID=1807 RepID=A0A0J6VFC4_9MYCO|nr:VOC family protein [Mycolicibacterium obuense]KMO68193.1 Glyoxalase-like domain protein [Mycolicibacterium obuense]